jgi:hypothetical protein
MPSLSFQATADLLPVEGDVSVAQQADRWWALEDLNLRPLPCQGRPAQPSYQRLCSSGGFRAISGVPSGTAWFGRLLDQVLTRKTSFSELAA